MKPQRHHGLAILAIAMVVMNACASLDGLESPGAVDDSPASNDGRAPVPSSTAASDGTAAPNVCPPGMVCTPIDSSPPDRDATDAAADALADTAIPGTNADAHANDASDGSIPDAAMSDGHVEREADTSTVCQPGPIDCAALPLSPDGVGWTCQYCSSYVVPSGSGSGGGGGGTDYGSFFGCVRPVNKSYPAIVARVGAGAACTYPASIQFQCEEVSSQICATGAQP